MKAASILLELNKLGAMHRSDLVALGAHSQQIARLVQTGEIDQLGAGFYGSQKLDPFYASLVGISSHYPQAVVSNLTALRLHELTDEIPDRIDVDVPRGTTLRNGLLRVHRVIKRKMIGTTELKVGQHIVRVYDLERSLCDAYKADKKGALYFKALKRYCERKDKDLSRLGHYDKALGTSVLDDVRQELADG